MIVSVERNVLVRWAEQIIQATVAPCEVSFVGSLEYDTLGSI